VCGRERRRSEARDGEETEVGEERKGRRCGLTQRWQRAAGKAYQHERRVWRTDHRARQIASKESDYISKISWEYVLLKYCSFLIVKRQVLFLEQKRKGGK